MIQNIINYIKEFSGIQLKLDGYFAGIKSTNSKHYFNVELPVRCSEYSQLANLERMTQQQKIITGVEPNGACRLAVFFDMKLAEKL